jgi:hypothetical protein
LVKGKKEGEAHVLIILCGYNSQKNFKKASFYFPRELLPTGVN